MNNSNDFDYERFLEEQNRPKNRSDRPEENAANSIYYAKGAKLEGQDQDVLLPEELENEGSAFDIYKSKHEDLLANAGVETDSYNSAIISESKTNLTKNLILGFILLALIAGVGYFLLGNKKDTAPLQTTTTLQVFPQVFGKDPVAAPQPRTIQDCPHCLIVKQTGDKITFTPNKTNPADPSTVFGGATMGPQDFTGAGILYFTGIKGFENVSSTVFYARDLAHLGQFQSMYDFQEVSISGSRFAGLATVDWQGKQTNFLVIVLPDDSGWFIPLPDNFTQEGYSLLPTQIKLGKVAITQ